VGEKRIIPYLKSQGIRVIDCAFVSHTDSDHMSGLLEILEAMPVNSAYRESVAGYTGTPVVKRIVLPAWDEITEGKSVILGVAETEENVETGDFQGEKDSMYQSLLKLAREKGVEVYSMEAGDRMTVGDDLTLFCLAPEAGVTYENKNAASMVLLVSYGEFDMLLTGDMEKEGERRLLARMTEAEETGLATQKDGISETAFGVGGVLRSLEVLKVSHHGSRTASSEEFVSALQPCISVISCGKNNRYGHPHTETLESLYGANSRVYRTDERGCVTVKVGKNIKVEEFKKEKQNDNLKVLTK